MNVPQTIRIYVAPGLSELAGHLAGPRLGSQPFHPAAGAAKTGQRQGVVHGKTMEKNENHWNTIGKPWKNWKIIGKP